MKERIFVVSDLHGIKPIYDGIVNYLDGIALCNPEKPVKLLINGDIIDRGPASMEILLDVIDRVNGKGFFKVEVIAGNHEMMMYEALQSKDDFSWGDTRKLNWFIPSNGAQVTALAYNELEEKDQKRIKSFLEDLEMQKVFDKELLDTKGVVVVHAHASKEFKNLAKLNNEVAKLKDIKEDIKEYLRYDILSAKYIYYFKTLWDRKKKNTSLGLEGYFTIVGHTPALNLDGYKYDKKDKVLNIDGGCSGYIAGYLPEIVVPLLELDFDNNQIIINRFNQFGTKIPSHLLTTEGIKTEKEKVLKI